MASTETKTTRDRVVYAVWEALCQTDTVGTATKLFKDHFLRFVIELDGPHAKEARQRFLRGEFFWVIDRIFGETEFFAPSQLSDAPCWLDAANGVDFWRYQDMITGRISSTQQWSKQEEEIADAALRLQRLLSPEIETHPESLFHVQSVISPQENFPFPIEFLPRRTSMSLIHTKTPQNDWLLCLLALAGRHRDDSRAVLLTDSTVVFPLSPATTLRDANIRSLLTRTAQWTDVQQVLQEQEATLANRQETHSDSNTTLIHPTPRRREGYARSGSALGLGPSNLLMLYFVRFPVSSTRIRRSNILQLDTNEQSSGLKSPPPKSKSPSNQTKTSHGFLSSWSNQPQASIPSNQRKRVSALRKPDVPLSYLHAKYVSGESAYLSNVWFYLGHYLEHPHEKTLERGLPVPDSLRDLVSEALSLSNTEFPKLVNGQVLLWSMIEYWFLQNSPSLPQHTYPENMQELYMSRPTLPNSYSTYVAPTQELLHSVHQVLLHGLGELSLARIIDIRALNATANELQWKFLPTQGIFISTDVYSTRDTLKSDMTFFDGVQYKLNHTMTIGFDYYHATPRISKETIFKHIPSFTPLIRILQGPLFHWFSIHFEQLQASPQFQSLFCETFELWLMYLTPWRTRQIEAGTYKPPFARGRLFQAVKAWRERTKVTEGDVYDADLRRQPLLDRISYWLGDLSFSTRQLFGLTDEAANKAAAEKQKKRQQLVGSYTVGKNEEAISSQLIHQIKYLDQDITHKSMHGATRSWADLVVRQIGDFASKRVPTKYHVTWQGWVIRNYTFYAHLLDEFIQKATELDLEAPLDLFSPGMVRLQGSYSPKSHEFISHERPLHQIERMLDVYEPCVIETLRTVSAVIAKHTLESIRVQESNVHASSKTPHRMSLQQQTSYNSNPISPTRSKQSFVGTEQYQFSKDDIHRIETTYSSLSQQTIYGIEAALAQQQILCALPCISLTIAGENIGTKQAQRAIQQAYTEFDTTSSLSALATQHEFEENDALKNTCPTYRLRYAATLLLLRLLNATDKLCTSLETLQNTSMNGNQPHTTYGQRLTVWFYTTLIPEQKLPSWLLQLGRIAKDSFSVGSHWLTTTLFDTQTNRRKEKLVLLFFRYQYIVRRLATLFELDQVIFDYCIAAHERDLRTHILSPTRIESPTIASQQSKQLASMYQTARVGESTMGVISHLRPAERTSVDSDWWEEDTTNRHEPSSLFPKTQTISTTQHDFLTPQKPRYRHGTSHTTPALLSESQQKTYSGNLSRLSAHGKQQILSGKRKCSARDVQFIGHRSHMPPMSYEIGFLVLWTQKISIAFLRGLYNLQSISMEQINDKHSVSQEVSTINTEQDQSIERFNQIPTTSSNLDEYSDRNDSLQSNSLTTSLLHYFDISDPSILFGKGDICVTSEGIVRKTNQSNTPHRTFLRRRIYEMSQLPPNIFRPFADIRLFLICVCLYAMIGVGTLGVRSTFFIFLLFFLGIRIICHSL